MLFARAALGEPRLLIADEPTRGVDVGAKRGIYDLIVGLAERGLGVLLISSEIEEILGLSHRVLVLSRGQVTAELTGDDINENAVMAAAFEQTSMLNFALLFRNYGILLVTIGLFVVLAVTADGFATERNLRNILDQQSMVIIAAAFMTIAIISGNFDVSVSAIFVTAPLFGLKVENMTGNVFLAVVAAIAVGLIMGAINGFIVTRLKINSFIGTLATSFMFFGAGFLISSRSLMRPETDAYRLIARSRFLGLTSATWIAIAVVIIATILLSRTRFGRNVFAVGGNMEAARLAGVAVNRVQTMAFLLLGAAAALAGVLELVAFDLGPALGRLQLRLCRADCRDCRRDIDRGRAGAIWRTTTAAFFLAFLNNGFNLLQIDPIWQRLIEGAVIIMAVAVDTWTKNRRA